MSDLAFGVVAKWPWLTELTDYLLAISTFGGAPWVLHQAAHVNVDIVLRVVPLWARAVLMRLAHSVGLTISVLVTWLAISAALDSFESGATVFKNIKFPAWWMMVPVIWCLALCSLEFFMRAMRGGKQCSGHIRF